MSVIIPRNVTIPTTRTERYRTAAHYQTAARIEVYQGESMIASHNHFLGQFEINKIPPKLAGREELDVRFSYDLNGMLDVTAILLSTGKEASIQINMTRAEEEEADLSAWKDAEGAKAYRAVIRTAERMLSGKNGDLSPGARQTLQETLDDLKRALVLGDAEEAASVSDDLAELLRIVRDER